MITEHYKEMPEPLYEDNDITIIYMWHPPKYHSILPHWHNRTEFILVLDGDLFATCASFSGVLTKDDILVVNPHQLHAAISGDMGVKYYAIILEKRLSNGLRVKYDGQYQSLFPSKYRFKNHIKDHKISSLLLNIIEEDSKKEPGHELFIQANVIELFAHLHRSYISDNQASSDTDPKLHNILTYIDENYSEEITTESIADLFGYNKSHFCRKFKQYTGTTLVNYLTVHRLEKAISLLQSTNKTIAEISETVGFGSPNYFTRQFVKYYGKKPREIRKSNTKDNIS